MLTTYIILESSIDFMPNSHNLCPFNNNRTTTIQCCVNQVKQKDSDTGTRTLVSCVKGKYANHLHHIGRNNFASTVNRTQGLQIFSLTLSQLSYRGS